MVVRRGVLVVVWGFVACAPNHLALHAVIDVFRCGVCLLGCLTVRWVWAARRWGPGSAGCGALPTRWPSGSSSGSWSSSACCASRRFAVWCRRAFWSRPLRLNGLKQCGFETDGCVISVDDTAIKHKLATARGPLPPAAARALYPPRARAPCERAAAASAPASPGPPTINPSQAQASRVGRSS